MPLGQNKEEKRPSCLCVFHSSFKNSKNGDFVFNDLVKKMYLQNVLCPIPARDASCLYPRAKRRKEEAGNAGWAFCQEKKMRGKRGPSPLPLPLFVSRSPAVPFNASGKPAGGKKGKTRLSSNYSSGEKAAKIRMFFYSSYKIIILLMPPLDLSTLVVPQRPNNEQTCSARQKHICGQILSLLLQLLLPLLILNVKLCLPPPDSPPPLLS